ncbi:MAG: arginine--tRNA ligase [Candidatus Omnitrophica bacterium]|nr:arginine--tRNA ligase [Candidatus Omnitrophota bacterium]
MSFELKNSMIGAIKEIIKENSLSQDENFIIDIEIPKEKKFGDWSINVAMKLARQVKKNPLEISRFISELLWKKANDLGFGAKIKAMEVKPPGFLNIFLSAEALFDVLKKIRNQKEEFGSSKLGHKEKIMIEFVSANPTGPLSIAHARQAAVGDTLANILTFCGYEVCREYYINDEGNQIRNLGLSLLVRYLEFLGYKDIQFPEQGYRGDYLCNYARNIKPEEVTGIDFAVIAQNMKSLGFLPEENIIEFFSNYAAAIILREIKIQLSEFGVIFDEWYSQKDHITKDKIENALSHIADKGYIYEKDKATWFKSTDLGDDKDRVIIKSDGLFTYVTPDIAYHNLKFERGFSRLINIWGPDHHGYINRIKAAVCALGHRKEELDILIIQLATLFRDGKPVKMSTRAGEYITLEELMSEVGKDAARFFFCMRRCDSQLEFDLELAKKQSLENPVYYIQYAHARISGIKDILKPIARQSGYKNLEEFTRDAQLELLKEEEALDIIRKLSNFPDVIENCSHCLDPQGLTTYLRELAGDFHSYYNKYRIKADDDSECQLTKARFFLVECVRQVIYNGLKLLGVSAPEGM